MPKKNRDPPILNPVADTAEGCTEVRRQEALLKTKTLQNAIFNSTNFSMIATDENGIIQLFNVGAERMLGYLAVDMVNKITPADISDPQEVIARAKALSVELSTPIKPGFEALVFKASRGIEDIYELTYIRKDGSRFPAVVSVTALRDAQDAIIGYLLIGTDNTARKQVEAERKLLDQRLRDQQFYTRSLIESNIDALMTTDPSGIITDVNNQMEALTGCTRDELIGTPFKNYFTDPERAEEVVKLVLSEEKVTNYELTVRAGDVKVTVVSYNATTFYDRDRRLQGVLAIARDITERRLAEEALQLRTIQLEAANQELEAFSYSVSHDLHTPLRAIDGFSRILLDEHAAELSSEAQRYLNLVRTNTQQMGELVDDLLTFSHLGRQPMTMQTVLPAKLVRKVLADYDTELENRNVEIKIGDSSNWTDQALPSCQADPALLKIVFSNLLSNSLKFTRTRDVALIEIGTQTKGGECIYYVKDNGVGFDMRYVHKLFGVFQRLHRAEEYEGTGVGLATVQRIIHRHGGRVWAEAEIDRGATFYFILGEGVSDV
jgi:PAS domain S-box-containing protein